MPLQLYNDPYVDLTFLFLQSIIHIHILLLLKNSCVAEI